MNTTVASPEPLAPEAFRFYRHALEILEAAKIPFLVGGAYAFGYYTGIARHTKDFDLFVRRAHVRRTLNAFARAGYPTDLVFSHWLGKVYHAQDFVDIIFSSGNGSCPVDDGWFENAVAGTVLGRSVRLAPVEEMIWQKAFIMERERFDGADVIHLLRARGRRLDWERMLARFGPHWRVLYSHLILFGFAYPADQENIPPHVLRALSNRLQKEAPSTDEHLCQGPLLSRTQYLADLEDWGYTDPRQEPLGPMSEDEVVRWTDAGR